MKNHNIFQHGQSTICSQREVPGQLPLSNCC